MWRNVSVLEGVLDAARYCAEGTIYNDRTFVGRCKYSWGSGGAVSPPAGPGQRPGGCPGVEAPESSEDTSFYSTKNGPKIDAFFPGYCSRNHKNWQTKNISENNLYILHKRGCYKFLIGGSPGYSPAISALKLFRTSS